MSISSNSESLLKVILINPKTKMQEWPEFVEPQEPMGLLYISGAIKALGSETYILDYCSGFGDEEYAMKLVQEEKFHVGISIPSQGVAEHAFDLARRFKQRSEQTVVFCGGIFATINAQWILDSHPSFDFVVLGEGEIFAKRYIKHPKNLEKIDGILTQGYNRTSSHLPVSLLTSPETRPDREMAEYILRRGGTLSLVLTRGCGGVCTYCAISRYYGSRWKPRSIDDVFDEISDLVETYDTSEFNILDDNLFGHVKEARAWIEEFLHLAADFYPKLSLRSTCRLDDLDETLIPKIKDAGINKMMIGIETLYQPSQRLYAKQIDIREAHRKIELLLTHDIRLRFGFIMFDPYVSPEGLMENLQFLLKYPESWMRQLLRSKLEGYNGTAIQRILKRDGLLSDSSALGFSWSFKNERTERVYRKFESYLQEYVYSQEMQLIQLEKRIRSIKNPILVKEYLSELRKIKSLDLRQLWIDLFVYAVENKSVTEDTLELQSRVSVQIESIYSDLCSLR